MRQLTALTAVADHGSFVAAAKALYTVQSNVSAHVAKLERELGATLFDRTEGRLTEAGELVVARARRVQGELDALRADLAALTDDVRGEVRIGVIGTTARWLVPRVLAKLRTEHPGVGMVVLEASTSSLIPQLTSGQLEVAVVNLPIDDPDVDLELLFDEELVLVAPLGHPLAHREIVTLGEVAEHPLILAPRGTGMRDDLDLEAARHGVRLRARAEVDGVRLMASLAFEGHGPAILPATAVPAWLDGPWRRVPVEGLPRRQVGLARRRRALLSAPARAVATTVVAIVATQGSAVPGVNVHAALPPDAEAGR